MKNRKIYTMIVIVLLMFEFLSLFLMYKSSNNEKNLNDLVKKELVVNDSEIPTDFIAMLFEKEDGSGYYESNSREWPDYMIFNSSKSGCLDKNGNRVLDALTYNDSVAKVITDGTIYCYLYFDIDRIPPVIKSATIIDSKYALDINTNVSISWDDKDVASYCVSNTLEYDKCEWIDTSSYSVSATHELSDGDGEKTIYFYVKDKAGNISEVKTDTITLDTESPSIPSLSSSYKDGSGNYASGKPTNKAVHTTITSKDLGSGIDYVERTKDKKSFVKVDFNISSLKQSGISWSGKFEWSTAKERDDKYYFRACDKAGRCSELSELFNIVYDFTPPTSNGVTINNGDLYTKNTDRIVTLELKSTDATEMCISNTKSCPANGWKNYEKNKSHTLTAGDGNKTVYVWYKDAAGNVIEEPVKDTIILDTTKPTGSIKINGGATYTNTKNGSVTLTLSATDTNDVKKMCISNTASCSSYIDYKTSYDWTLTDGDGSKTVYVWYKDAAGNVSSRYSDSITLDTEAPECTLEVTTSGIAFENKSTETSSYGMGTSKSYNSKTSLSLAKGTFYGYVKDAAGNEGKCSATLTDSYVSKYNKTTNKCVANISSYECKKVANQVGYCSGIYSECTWCSISKCVVAMDSYVVSTCIDYTNVYDCNGVLKYYDVNPDVSNCKLVQGESHCEEYNYSCKNDCEYSSSDDTCYCYLNDYNASYYTCSEGELSGSTCYKTQSSACTGSWSQNDINYTYDFDSSTTLSSSCSKGTSFTCGSGSVGSSYVSACTPKEYSCETGTKITNDYCYTID